MTPPPQHVALPVRSWVINLAVGRIDFNTADLSSLIERLETITDPRDPRGIRHSFASTLVLIACATLAGHKSLVTISEWCDSSSEEVLARLGARVSPRSGLRIPPSYAPTLDDAGKRGLLMDVEAIWLDRGYDSEATRQRLIERDLDDAVIAKKRKRGSTEPKRNQPMGLRRPVERTNSWLSNFGSLRRNNDRRTVHRLAQLALAVVFLLTAKLIDWRNRWSQDLSPIR